MKKLLKKFLAWFTNNGWQFFNVAALIGIYAVNKGQLGVELISGLWLFILAGTYGWKWFNRNQKDKILKNL